MKYKAVRIKRNAKIFVLGRVEFWDYGPVDFVASPMENDHLKCTAEGWPTICVHEDDCEEITDEH